MTLRLYTNSMEVYNPAWLDDVQVAYGQLEHITKVLWNPCQYI